MLNSTNEGECASNQGGIVPEHDAAQENLAVNVDTVAEKALYELKRHESGDQYMGFESGDAPKEMAKEITPIEKAEVSDHVDPFVGMVFESEEDAKEYYLAYALRVGFIIRSNRVLRSKRDGTNIGRDFVCSKEGFRAKKYQGTLRPRPKTREGCKAMLRVKKEDSGKWVVSKFSEEHSHALVPPKKVPRPRTRRQPDAIGISNNSFNDSGIKSSNGSLLGSQPVGPTSFGPTSDIVGFVAPISQQNGGIGEERLEFFDGTTVVLTSSRLDMNEPSAFHDSETDRSFQFAAI
ncbi:hypothetical protein AMTR_s00066p00106190 [Amborella trichopoda]|uniref:FAR1 domain-containing protein n=1 Tax=Amborella trichopoda TaxID=13333 RepID=U5DD85_AMBTC|nr:hypothetical protein AMTR_s00066p00106190 [Amborella trichopoda]